MPVFDTYKIETLATPTLTLEPLTVSHAGELFEHLSNPEMYEFLPQDPPPSIVALRERYQRWESRRSPSGSELWLNWIIRHESVAAGLQQATCTKTKKALIAYQIVTPFQRRGIATEAIPVMLNHLHQAAAIETARALVDTRNARSIRLLERLGFAKTRLIRDADHFKGAASHEFEYELGLTPATKAVATP